MSTREEQIKEMLKTPELCEIRKLYRYRSMESQELEGIFTERQVCLRKTTDFNDPFDCNPKLIIHMSRLKRELYLRTEAKRRFPLADSKTLKRHIINAKINLTSDAEAFAKKSYEEFLDNTGFYCLSEINDDILMWSHYADGHRGVCLEFDAINDAVYANRMLFGQAIKVIYSKRRPVFNIFNIGEPVEFIKAFLTKSDHWKYEKEWRVIKIPDEGGPGLKSFDPRSLTGVIFGYLMSPENRQRIMEWINRYPIRLSLYQAKINEVEFKVDIEPI